MWRGRRGCGTADDVAGLPAIRDARPDALIQIDANGAWSAKQAIAALPRLEQYDVELIEQPVRAEDVEALAPAAPSTRLPVYADEGCVTHATSPASPGPATAWW